MGKLSTVIIKVPHKRAVKLEMVMESSRKSTIQSVAILMTIDKTPSVRNINGRRINLNKLPKIKFTTVKIDAARASSKMVPVKENPPIKLLAM